MKISRRVAVLVVALFAVTLGLRMFASHVAQSAAVIDDGLGSDGRVKAFRNGMQVGSLASKPSTVSGVYIAFMTTNFQGLAATSCKDSADLTFSGTAPFVNGDVCSLGLTTSKNVSYICIADGAGTAKVHICNGTGSTVNFTPTKYTLKVTH